MKKIGYHLLEGLDAYKNKNVKQYLSWRESIERTFAPRTIT